MKTKLQSLYKLADESYDLVIDTCCDHGKLGMAFLNDFPVLFVDQVPSIMKNLERILVRTPHDNYKLETKKAQDLVLAPNKNLVCIAGIGGIQLISILESLLKNNDLKKSHFLLSPQYQLFEVRRFLIAQGFKKIKEELIFEKGKGRELFYLSLESGEEICPIGENLFDPEDQESRAYFQSILNHLLKKEPEGEPTKLYQKLFKVLG